MPYNEYLDLGLDLPSEAVGGDGGSMRSDRASPPACSDSSGGGAGSQERAAAGGWETHYAPDGRPYYHNASSGVTTWELPPRVLGGEGGGHNGMKTSVGVNNGAGDGSVLELGRASCARTCRGAARSRWPSRRSHLYLYLSPRSERGEQARAAARDAISSFSPN